nr:hypothetical protein [Leifsonia aquatica]
MSLGFEGEDLVAVVVVEDSSDGPEFFHIAVVAIEHERRAAGRGAIAIEHAIDLALAAAAPHVERLIVTANIHERNRPSESVFARTGFTPDTGVGRDAYRQWLLSIDIAD